MTDANDQRAVPWRNSNHAQNATSCVVPNLKRSAIRKAFVETRPEIGWAASMTTQQSGTVNSGASVLSPPEGYVWYDSGNEEHDTAMRDENQGDVALGFEQVYELIKRPGYKLYPYCLLDESLTVYASLMYTEKERSLYWSRNFDRTGNPRLKRPRFGKPPACHIGLWVEDGTSRWFETYKSYYMVYKRRLIMAGNNPEQGYRLESNSEAWTKDSYAWSFGQCLMEADTADDHLKFYYTIGPYLTLQNLPEDLSLVHFSCEPLMSSYMSTAVAQRKIPFYVGFRKFPIPLIDLAHKLADADDSTRNLSTVASDDTEQYNSSALDHGVKIRVNYISPPGDPHKEWYVRVLLQRRYDELVHYETGIVSYITVDRQIFDLEADAELYSRQQRFLEE